VSRTPSFPLRLRDLPIAPLRMKEVVERVDQATSTALLSRKPLKKFGLTRTVSPGRMYVPSGFQSGVPSLWASRPSNRRLLRTAV